MGAEVALLEHPRLFFVICILSLPFYWLLAKFFFGEKLETLGEAIEYLIVPNWYSLLRGKLLEDWAATWTELIAGHLF
jgi:hypothetical protein